MPTKPIRLDTSKIGAVSQIWYAFSVKAIGIDYGRARIGIARSDDGGHIAFPVAVVPGGFAGREKIASFLAAEKPDVVVFGVVPNDTTNLYDEIAEFAAALERDGYKIDYVDESLTSHEVRLREFGKDQFNARQTKKDLAQEIDASAAALLLQRYLEKHNR